MNREYHQWYSSSLGRGMELLVFGHAGAPVIVFPTSMGRFYQYEDSEMVEALRDRLDNGWLQLFCIDSVDNESWYNNHVSPSERISRHLAYDRYVTEEVLPFIRNKNQNNFIITTGCSFGAFQSINYGFRHPEIVRKIVAQSGRYNVHTYLDGFVNNDVYYNVPVDYIGGLGEGDLANRLRSQEIFLIAGEWDVPVCLYETRQLAGILELKGIPHRLDIWGGYDHDWPAWRTQIRNYL
jgi:esterase/lipase superfamily enzyme